MKGYVNYNSGLWFFSKVIFIYLYIYLSCSFACRPSHITNYVPSYLSVDLLSWSILSCSLFEPKVQKSLHDYVNDSHRESTAFDWIEESWKKYWIISCSKQACHIPWNKSSDLLSQKCTFVLNGITGA